MRDESPAPGPVSPEAGEGEAAMPEAPSVEVLVEALRGAAPQGVVAEVGRRDPLFELLVLGAHEVPEVDLALSRILAGHHSVDDEEVGPAVEVSVDEEAAPRPGCVPDVRVFRRPLETAGARGAEE